MTTGLKGLEVEKCIIKIHSTPMYIEYRFLATIHITCNSHAEKIRGSFSQSVRANRGSNSEGNPPEF